MRLKKRDWALILGLLLLAGALQAAAMLNRAPAAEALISVSGMQVRVMPLDEAGSFTGEGALGPFTVEAGTGGIRMTHSTCPDGLCIRQGLIARTGQSIVCLPNQVAVTLSGAGGPMDAVSY